MVLSFLARSLVLFLTLSLSWGYSAAKGLSFGELAAGKSYEMQGGRPVESVRMVILVVIMAMCSAPREIVEMRVERGEQSRAAKEEDERRVMKEGRRHKSKQ